MVHIHIMTEFILVHIYHKGSGPMYEVKVKIINAKVRHRLPACSLHIIRVMVGAPKLSNNKEVFSRDVFVDDISKDLAYFLFVEVDFCTIDVTIAVLQSKPENAN